MFMVIPANFIKEKVASTESGMATEIIKVELMFLRNRRRIKTARRPPCQARWPRCL